MAMQRFEANNVESFEDALNGALTVLEDNGMSGTGDEPNVAIVLRQNGTQNNGINLVDAIIYIDATPQQIAQDLNAIQ